MPRGELVRRGAFGEPRALRASFLLAQTASEALARNQRLLSRQRGGDCDSGPCLPLLFGRPFKLRSAQPRGDTQVQLRFVGNGGVSLAREFSQLAWDGKNKKGETCLWDLRGPGCGWRRDSKAPRDLYSATKSNLSRGYCSSFDYGQWPPL